MANINLDIEDALKEKLKIRAKNNLRSMANEIRAILKKELGEEQEIGNFSSEGLKPQTFFMEKVK